MEELLGRSSEQIAILEVLKALREHKHLSVFFGVVANHPDSPPSQFSDSRIQALCKSALDQSLGRMTSSQLRGSAGIHDVGVERSSQPR